MKNKTKVYAERDTIELGEHFALHMDAMTREELHGKFEIAAELAYRDKQLTEAKAEVERLGREVRVLVKQKSSERIRAEKAEADFKDYTESHAAYVTGLEDALESAYDMLDAICDTPTDRQALKGVEK